jgi:hypothetical protein
MEWPDPVPIELQLMPVQQFTEDLLPDALRPLVLDIAERMQVPKDFPAISVVLCLAGAIGRRATIQPKAKDTSWVVVPNLWGGIVAQPGFMKSPVIQSVLRPLVAIEREWQAEQEGALAEYRRRAAEWEIKRSVWREQVKKQVNGGLVVPIAQGDKPQPPVAKRIIVNDSTFEKLHETMRENPAGVLVIRDELTGWLAELDRGGREGERAFYLQAWNGDIGHKIERIGRGSIFVPACCLSMLGGIQPDKLRSYLSDASETRLQDDGLIQRFQLLVWPDPSPDYTYIDRLPDAAALDRAERVFRKLAHVDTDPNTVLRFTFAPDAQEWFVGWTEDLENTVRRGNSDLAMVSHLSKYRSLMPSLALIFALADQAAGFAGFAGFVGSGANDVRKSGTVSLEHACQAIRWCCYLESHARRIYGCGTDATGAAKALSKKILEKRIACTGYINIREVYQNGWSQLDTPVKVKSAIEILSGAGWVREVVQEAGPTGGRPSERYQINPKVWELKCR